jgi:SPP1 family predicted phage head-tail adaptor
MICNPGLLDKRIDVYLNDTDSSGTFDTIKAKPLYHRIAASIIPARGRAYREAAMTTEKANVTITIRYRANISTACVVTYRTHVYRVVDVIDPSQQHESLELYCVETIRGTTPTKEPSSSSGGWEP